MKSLHFSRCKVAPSVALFLHLAHFGTLSIHKKIFTNITFYDKVGDHHDYHQNSSSTLSSLSFTWYFHLFCILHISSPGDVVAIVKYPLLNKQATLFEPRFVRTNFFHSHPNALPSPQYHFKWSATLLQPAKGLARSPVWSSQHDQHNQQHFYNLESSPFR